MRLALLAEVFLRPLRATSTGMAARFLVCGRATDSGDGFGLSFCLRFWADFCITVKHL